MVVFVPLAAFLLLIVRHKFNPQLRRQGTASDVVKRMASQESPGLGDFGGPGGETAGSSSMPHTGSAAFGPGFGSMQPLPSSSVVSRPSQHASSIELAELTIPHNNGAASAAPAAPGAGAAVAIGGPGIPGSVQPASPAVMDNSAFPLASEAALAAIAAPIVAPEPSAADAAKPQLVIG